MPDERLMDASSDLKDEARSASGDHNVVVSLAEEWDLARQDELRRMLGAATGPLTVDLREVTFFDSCAISVLVATRKRLAAQQASMQVRVGDADFVRRTLETVGLSSWIVD
jgi:anti-anti-sigma factor